MKPTQDNLQKVLTSGLQRQSQRLDLISMQLNGQEEEHHEKAKTPEVQGSWFRAKDQGSSFNMSSQLQGPGTATFW